MDVKTALKKFWKFIWYDDSILSWIVTAIIAFVLVKFILFPGLGLVLGTDLPIVAVVSGSMEHKTTAFGNQYHACGTMTTEKKNLNFDEFWDFCGEWYETNGITKEQFQTFRFKNGFNTGSVMMLKGKDPKELEVGEVIVFQDANYCQRTGRCDPIIHRIVKITEEEGKRTFQTKGDHNAISDVIEMNIQEDQIIGKAVFAVPWLGYVKLIAVKLLNGFRS